jgi:carboxypeptidase family protein
MFSKLNAAFLAAILCVTSPALHSAAGTVVSGTVSGTDQGFLTGASIVIEGPVRRSARSDADGRFTFTDVPSGQYRIEVTADGYLPLERPLEVHTASVSVDIVLLRIPSVP